MSSTVSQTELQAMPNDEAPPPPATARTPPPQLVRSTSVEKIIKFNAYICSQNYYILPALLVWLKTSQNALSHHVERSIAYVKLSLIATAVYRLLVDLYVACTIGARGAAVRTFAFVVERFDVLSAYAAIGVIAAQLVTCLIVVCNVFLPTGFIFMVVCMFFMGHVATAAMFHYMKSEEAKANCGTIASGGGGGDAAATATTDPTKPDRMKRKLMHDDRTISNVNLF